MSNHSAITPLSSSLTARRLAKVILNGFESYFAEFQNLTLAAKARFEKSAWQIIQDAHYERITLYKVKVNKVTRQVIEATSKDLGKLELWAEAKTAYQTLIQNHSNYDIAETFFNSIFCAHFDHRHIHDRYMFVKPSRNEDEKPLKDYSIYITYPVASNLAETLEQIFSDFAFSIPWENSTRDIQFICSKIDRELGDEAILRIEILESIFYRNKAAYLIARMQTETGARPFIIPFLNDQDTGVYADTVLLHQDACSILFSFTRAYFMVDAPIPSRFVRFLSTLMPAKDRSELYTAIGFNKHGKTRFYRNVIEHMKVSDDLFVEAPGIRGMVMSVFTLPSYDVVFKVIKDKFDFPKQVTEAIVKEKYKLVSRTERAGRMADTQEYSNFIFYRNRFSPELLEELLKVAPSKIELTEKWIILKHVYTERRMTPLNIYLQDASEEELAIAMDEYGNAIKQLAAANIFTGDMLLKNFGVTRHQRVVFYDYDEICKITECNFRKIPEPRNEFDDLSDKPWYTVADNDVFPEEFRLFFSGNPKARKVFESLHKDLYDYRYWQDIQDRLNKGHIENTFPYRRQERFNPAR